MLQSGLIRHLTLRRDRLVMEKAARRPAYRSSAQCRVVDQWRRDHAVLNRAPEPPPCSVPWSSPSRCNDVAAFVVRSEIRSSRNEPTSLALGRAGRGCGRSIPCLAIVRWLARLIDVRKWSRTVAHQQIDSIRRSARAILPMLMWPTLPSICCDPLSIFDALPNYPQNRQTAKDLSPILRSIS